jgi:hypothetical protein
MPPVASALSAAASQTRTVPSLPPETSSRPSAEKATQVTVCLCPRKVAVTGPSARAAAGRRKTRTGSQRRRLVIDRNVTLRDVSRVLTRHGKR